MSYIRVHQGGLKCGTFQQYSITPAHITTKVRLVVQHSQVLEYIWLISSRLASTKLILR